MSDPKSTPLWWRMTERYCDTMAVIWPILLGLNTAVMLVSIARGACR